MKITKIYTRHGDQGTTGLVGGVRISKTHVRLEAYGTIDELCSHVGLLAAMMGDDEEVTFLHRIQCILFNIGSNLATDQTQTTLYDSAHVPEGEIQLIEQRIDHLNGQLPDFQGFVLPGGTMAASQCHVCRTVCRRAERRIVALAEEAAVEPDILQYVNRLSDYLFILAKIINFNAGHNEILWQNACK